MPASLIFFINVLLFKLPSKQYLSNITYSRKIAFFITRKIEISVSYKHTW